MSGEISLYFHVPFCKKKCGYCHFYSEPFDSSAKAKYLEALLREWATKKTLLEGKKIVSVYFGGGTPSLLAPDDLQTLLQPISREGIEITLEANPDSVSYEYMKALFSLGINRISLGVQSFDDDNLKRLHRLHDSKKARLAIQAIAKAGFQNLSIDLMYDLPLQTLASWQEEIKIARDLPITHLSLYNLTIEPHTPFFQRKAELESLMPSPEESREALRMAKTLLEEKGFSHYEISAFAKESFHSRHNCGYWTGREYLGLGPGAYSYVDGTRFRNTPNLKRYIEDSQLIDESETLGQSEKTRELLVLNLRLLCGVDLKAFEVKAGPLSKETEKEIEKLIEKGLLRRVSGQLMMTEKGLFFYDTIAVDLI